MINRIIKDIETAVDAKAYIAALALALTLPDICGKVAYPSESPTSRYKKWYSEHIGKYENIDDDSRVKAPFLSADVVFSLRCSLLHQGTVDLTSSRISQPENQGIDVFHLIIDDAITADTSRIDQTFINGEWVKTHVEWDVNVVNLCWKLCRCASSFYKENEDKFNFGTDNIRF